MKFRSFGDSTSSGIEDKQKKVTIVNFRVNERSSNSAGSILINSSTNT